MISPKTEPRTRPLGKAAVREALLLWALAFASIAISRLIGPIAGYAKAVAAIAFLYLPGVVVWRRNEDYRDYGATLVDWQKGLLLGAVVSVIILPLFVAAYFGFVDLLSHVPKSFSGLLAPYPHYWPPVSFRLPHRFFAHVVDQLLVVALPEELFYRGYIQTRLRDAWPEGRSFFGARLGKAFWVTQILFALGHLTEPYPWRLGVFFPALVFGWMREKSGTIVPGTMFHAFSNLTMLVLEASFFGRR